MESSEPRRLTIPLIAIGVFLLFAAGMALLAGTMVLWPGTVLDRLWRLNPAAQQALTSIGSIAGPGFYALAILLMATAVAWFQQRIWGWRLTVAILLTQALGDLVNLARGGLLRGSTGMVIAGALILFLLRPSTRSAFR